MDGGLVRLRLDLGYDGGDFSGWAKQPTRRTVQGVLEDELSRVLRRDVSLTVAGRTDAGVHATGQVAHVDVPADVVPEEPERLVRRLAKLLPADVRVYAVRPVPNSFDARFSALRRHYRYRVTTAPYGAEPLRAHEVVPWPRDVSIDAMNEAARRMLGEHDFVAFCKRREGATTIRELQRFGWFRESCQTHGGAVVTAEVSADAFCHSMVRSLVGAVLAVGEGRRPVDWPAQLLSATERSSAVGVAPARGLSLVGVDYPPEDELAARAATTRRRRDEETGEDCAENAGTAGDSSSNRV